MAGSRAFPPHPGFTDPVLSARLEALQLLADKMCSRVMVIDRDLSIVYANQDGWGRLQQDPAGDRPAKCYEAFVQGSDPCTACPAREVFASGQVRTIYCSVPGDGSSCGMQQAYPLMSSRGQVDSVLVLFGKGSKSHEVECLTTETSTVPGTGRESGDLLGGLIGESTAMRELASMVTLVAGCSATVLLQGESGTGKELVARMIHRLSQRRDRPFVVVDCGSIPETLLESELFGHVKGAFTGAVASRKGLFEQADGGTLFLDEIVDTSLNFQSKLLRVLQEGEMKPVGSSRSIKVDVRVLSATNKDMLEQVKLKAFREDLYYRLSVLPLLLPPLRDRPEDIPLLIRHFASESSRRHRKPEPTICPTAVEALKDAAWPGNVRELQHLIERVVVTASSSVLSPIDFFGPSGEPAGRPDLRSVSTEAKHKVERQQILEALRRASGNRAEAARLLKISRAGLYNKLRIYQIK